MAQQGKQMRVGACEGFAYHSLKVVLLANGNRYMRLIPILFFSGKALYPFEVLPYTNSELAFFFFFYTHSYL
jgi:hypothetical protein